MSHLGHCTNALHRSLVFRRKIHVSKVAKVYILGARERNLNLKQEVS